MFHSQQEEDKTLYSKYLNYRDGFFIELGAMDGIEYSNTLFFERILGWNGVLIEASKNQFDRLISNRPNCHNFNYAVSTKEGFVEFLGEGALGGMTHTMNDGHRYGWGLEKNFGFRPYMIKSSPISKILSPLNIKRVDLFSIDVEGGEIEVLKTFDWNIPVYIILIEGCYNTDEEGKEKIINDSISKGYGEEKGKILVEKLNECKEILLHNGFEFDSEVGCNEIWINKKNKRDEN